MSFPLSYALQDPVAPSGMTVFILLGSIGVLGFAGQMFKTQGLKWEKAGPGSMMRNLDLVFAFVFQATVVGESVYVLSVLGALITLTSSVAMGVLKLRKERVSSYASLATRAEEENDDDDEDAVVRVSLQSERGL